MGQEYAIGGAGRIALVEAEGRAFVHEHAAAVELAEAEFRSLQIEQNADRMAMLVRYVAHDGVQRFRRLVAGVAHVDAEYVDTRDDETLHHFW